MPGIGRLLCIVACGGAMSLLPLGVADATAAPEWNPVRTRTVQIGPEARRLVVGFRATAGNSVVKSIRLRSRAQSVKITVAVTSQADVARLAQRTGLAVASSRQVTPSMHVVYLQKTLYGAQAKAALKALRADAAVEFAEVDQRRYPHAVTVPDDPLFPPGANASGQWFMGTPSATPIVLGGVSTMDLSATDAVSAWSVTTGSSGTVIADVDTGVRFDHPDLLRAGLGGRLLPGYDFVDQDYDRTTGAALGTFLIANDGDGWDPDPSDPGDWISATDLKNPLFPPTECGDPNSSNGPSDSSWHGTRVMGVLGALTNNSVGVAGMTWNPYLLPVRALGKCGGYDSDIISGMQWAVGMSVTDPSGNAIPDNPYPADIINLSLGGTDTCPSDYKNLITTLAGMGVVVVASAGNGGASVDTPGNCPGVLAVVGLRNVGTKVGYSSMGPEAGIAAPAGNCVVTTGGCFRSIDTTVNEGLTVPTTNSYTNQINPNLGTSFSAPIVSGVVALMRAVNANLTPPQLIARIKSSATAFPQPAGLPVCPATATDPTTMMSTGECACPNDDSECGAGMVNALSAVNAALKPISVITKSGGSNTTFDASGSVAACNLTVKSYAWAATGGIAIQGAANTAQVTVASNGSPGTLTLTVTDSAGHVDNTGTVSFDATGAATVNTPAAAGTAATACPTAMTVTPAPPTITEAFSPATVTIGDMPTLTITFNNANGFDLTQSNFTETLPTGLSIETSPAPSTTCTGTSGNLTTTASKVTLTGADIPPKGSCSITLTVSGAAGTYASAIAVNALMTGPAGGNSAAVSASLTVNQPPLPVPSKKGGGGELDWLDMMFVAGVLLVGRRQAGRQAARVPVRRPRR